MMATPPAAYGEAKSETCCANERNRERPALRRWDRSGRSDFAPGGISAPGLRSWLAFDWLVLIPRGGKSFTDLRGEFGRGLLARGRDNGHLLVWTEVVTLFGDRIGQFSTEQDDRACHKDPEQQCHGRTNRAIATDHIVLF